jgi:hypothetical protein
MVLSFKNQSSRQLPNGFQILLSQKLQCTLELLTGFQQLLYFKSQSIGQLPNGFQISCSLRSQSIGQLPNGLGRIQNSQSQSIGQLPNGLLDALYTKHSIREASLTDVVCTNIQLRISLAANTKMKYTEKYITLSIPTRSTALPMLPKRCGPNDRMMPTTHPYKKKGRIKETSKHNILNSK